METRAFPCRINLNGHEFDAVATFETTSQAENIDYTAAVRAGIAAFNSGRVYTDLGYIIEDQFPLEEFGLQICAEVRDNEDALAIIARPAGCTNDDHFVDIAKFSFSCKCYPTSRKCYPAAIRFGEHSRIVGNRDELELALGELLATRDFGEALAAYRGE